MTQVLEEILGGHQISDFSREWIENSATNVNTIRATYNALKSIGLKDEKIATQAHLLGRDPETIERNYQRLSDLGLKDEKIASRAELLGMDPETIERNYQRLSALGLRDEKIATQAPLLGRDPETIEENYQNHIGLLRSDYEDRKSGKDILLQQAQLLGISPDTLETNVQWFSDRNIDYGKGILLGTKVQTKRKKLAWILREVFDYRNVSKDERNQTVRNMYNLIEENPNLMINSIGTLEKMKDKLVEKAQQYK